MIEKIEFSSGVRLVHEEIPFVRSVSIGIWVLNGSNNEKASLSGMSHFIEHMMFKGTTNRSAKDIADEMDGIGGQMNAYTAKECTCYHTRVLDEHFDRAFDIMQDMYFNSKFDGEEIEKERNVIFEEINMYEDSPDELCHDLMQADVWQDNSLGQTILGTKKTLDGINHNKMRSYYQQFYTGERTVISIAGNITLEKAVQKIEQYFSKYAENISTKKSVLDVTNEEVKFHFGVTHRKKDIEQLHICLGFKGLCMGHDEAYVLAVLNTLFGGGMSSKLFQNIREDKGLVYSIYSYVSNYKEVGLFNIYCALNKSQGKKAIAEIVKEMEKMSREELSEKIISRTKEQIKSNYLLSFESTSSRMSQMGRGELLLGRILTPDEIAGKIDAVTGADILKLSKKIFDVNNMSLSAVGNIEKKEVLDFIKF